MAAIEKDDSNPLHTQVSDFIRERIYSQEWGVNERIPSEHELMEMLGVSRGTVQKGIKTLADEGLLVQTRGKGTFVTKPVVQHPSGSSLLSFAESLRMQGIDFETKVLGQEIISANRACGEKLQVPENSPVLYLRRVRTVGGEPILYMESRLSLIACPGLERLDYSKRTLFSAVEETSGRKIGFAKVRYGARVAGKERGAVLGCDEKAPVLNIDQIIYLENNVPAEWGNMWLPANKYVISSVLQRM